MSAGFSSVLHFFLQSSPAYVMTVFCGAASTFMAADVGKAGAPSGVPRARRHVPY